MDNHFDDYYLLLEVHVLASEEVIRAAYKKLSQRYHPDNGGDETAFLKIQEAYAVLSQAESRKVYFSKWKKQALSQVDSLKQEINHSLYDISFWPSRQKVLEYMFFIKNGKYDIAYDLISEKDKKWLYKKDFVVWQELIGQIHQLMDFDCAIETVSPHQIVFMVKVIEKNMLLNRIEDDYFQRRLIFEKGEWRIYLGDMNIKGIIKKYRQILAINRKNKKTLKRIMPMLEEPFSTKQVSFDSFLLNCEYEYLKYLRYQRPTAMMKLNFCHLTKSSASIEDLEAVIDRLLDKIIRKTDTLCHYDRGVYLLMMPETQAEQCELITQKLKYHLIEARVILKSEDLVIKISAFNATCKSGMDCIKKLISV